MERGWNDHHAPIIFDQEADLVARLQAEVAADDLRNGRLPLAGKRLKSSDISFIFY